MMEKELPPVSTVELTDRERQILKLLATGTSNKEIARDLVISSNTVKVHLRNIFAKIGAASRTEAAMYAVHSGLVKSQAAQEQTNGALTAANSAASEATAPSRRIFRMANVIVVLVLLVVVVIIGIILARQQAGVGANTNLPTPTVESRWHVLAPLPTARTGFAAIAYENQVYTIGGETADGVKGTLERYDPTTDTWIELAQKPMGVTDINAAAIGGKIYVPGGRRASGDVTDTLEIYDPRNNTWEKGSPLPVAMSAYAMASFEGQLYLFGGWDGKKSMDSVFTYDPGQNKWAELTPMDEPRAHASATVMGDKIYVLGGTDGTRVLANNSVYTPHFEGTNPPWSKAKDLPVACSNLGVANVADNIYVFGRQGTSVILFTFFPQINEWQKLDPPSENIAEGARLAQLGEYLFIIGGELNELPSNKNLAYQAIYTTQIQVIIKK